MERSKDNVLTCLLLRDTFSIPFRVFLFFRYRSLFWNALALCWFLMALFQTNGVGLEPTTFCSKADALPRSLTRVSGMGPMHSTHAILPELPVQYFKTVAEGEVLGTENQVGAALAKQAFVRLLTSTFLRVPSSIATVTSSKVPGESFCQTASPKTCHPVIHSHRVAHGVVRRGEVGFRVLSVPMSTTYSNSDSSQGGNKKEFRRQ